MASNSPNQNEALDRVNAMLAAIDTGPGMLLPALHAIQNALGYLPADAVQPIANAFNLSRAEVHGVITFYHHFRTAPPAKIAVQVCVAEACQSMQCSELLAHAEKSLGCQLHQRSADGSYSLEPVYCLGQCATSPAIMINDALHARVSPAKFDRIVAKAKEAA